MTAIKKFFAKNWLTVVLGVLTLLTFFVPDTWAGYVASHSSSLLDINFSLGNDIFNLLRVAIMVGFVWSILRKVSVFRDFSQDIERAPKFAKVLMITLPLLILLVVAIELINPEFATWLIRCDDLKRCGVNFRHAIFVKAAFELTAAVIFAILAVKLHKQSASRHNKLLVIICVILTLVLLLMTGEELAWGQRIFFFATPAAVKAVNAQGELTLHNMATELFQNSWYFASWIILIALPLLRQPLAKLLAKTRKLAPLINFLPPSYFILAFAPVFAIVTPIWASDGIRSGSILFSVIATVAILAYLIWSARGKLANHLCFVLSIFTITLFVELLVSQVWNKNSGDVTEYEEVFLAFGLFLWALTTWRNFSAPKRAFTSERDKRIAK